MGKQVEKLVRSQNGGNVGDDPSIKYQVENQDLRNRVQQMKEEIKLKEQKMKEMEASLLEKKEQGCSPVDSFSKQKKSHAYSLVLIF